MRYPDWMYLKCEVCRKKVLRKRVNQKSCGRPKCLRERQLRLLRDRARKQRERKAKAFHPPGPSDGYKPSIVVVQWRGRRPTELNRDFADRYIQQGLVETTGRRINSVDDVREAVET